MSVLRSCFCVRLPIGEQIAVEMGVIGHESLLEVMTYNQYMSEKTDRDTYTCEYEEYGVARRMRRASGVLLLEFLCSAGVL
jgi:hypothetical protein